MTRTLLIAACVALMGSGCTKSDSKITSNSGATASVDSSADIHAIPQDAVVLNFRVTGMHCDGCANAVKGKLATLEGVFASEASFESKSATVTAASPDVAERALAAVKELGYEVELMKE